MVLDEGGKTTFEGSPWMSDSEGLDVRAYAQGLQQLLIAVEQDPVMTISAPDGLDFQNIAAVEEWLLENASVCSWFEDDSMFAYVNSLLILRTVLPHGACAARERFRTILLGALGCVGKEWFLLLGTVLLRA